MPKILDLPLYNKVKLLADDIYKKPSAFKSGFIIKTYKNLGGKYADDNQPKNLKRWFLEKWQDIADLEYPVFRPTVKISKTKTPLLVSEINKKNLKEQIKLKQLIKGSENLPKFQKKL